MSSRRTSEQTPHKPRLADSLQTPQAFHRGVQNATELGLNDSKQLLRALEQNTQQITDRIVDEFTDLVEFEASSLSFSEVVDAIKHELLKTKRENKELKSRVEAAEAETEVLEDENEVLSDALQRLSGLNQELARNLEAKTTTVSAPQPVPKSKQDLAELLLQGDLLYQRFMETSQRLQLL